jgi:hypothetical protein
VAKLQQKAVNDGMVRVRVRPGNRLRVGREEFAEAGQWIELVAHDLEIESVRNAVETQEQIDAGVQLSATEEKKRSESRAMFEELRQGAIQHNQAYARANAAGEKHMARELDTRALEREQTLKQAEK